MPIAQSLLPEFDQEMAATRRLLERTPDADAAWKPHEKSWPLGHLAMHVANLPSWTNVTLEQDELDLEPPDGKKWVQPAFESTAALLRMFDENVKKARATIELTSDQAFHGNWSLKGGGQTYFTLPKVAVMRSFVMNHLIHHRGQLTVYFRLRNVPLPQLYGPTADES
jgi:uncharacterized damage-inducible protein DinB